MTPNEPRHEKTCLGTDQLIFGVCVWGGRLFFFFPRFSSDRKTKIFFFLTVRGPKYFFFRTKKKENIFFLTAYMLEMYSFRFIRSCISWTQYACVCFYMFVYTWIFGSECIWAATWQNQQNGCAPSLIRVFAVRMKKHLVLSYALSVQRRLW